MLVTRRRRNLLALLVLTACSSGDAATSMPDASAGGAVDGPRADPARDGAGAPDADERCRSYSEDGGKTVRIWQDSIAVVVDVAGLATATGEAPVAPVCLRFRRVPVRNFADMPGGFHGVDAHGADVVLSVQAVVELAAEDGARRPLLLAAGQQARLEVFSREDLTAWRRDDEPRPWQETLTASWEPADVSGTRRYRFALPAFGTWTFARGVPPLCKRAILKNACGEVVPNAMIEALVYADGPPVNGDRALTDAAGMFRIAGAYASGAYVLVVRVGERTFRVGASLPERPDCAPSEALLPTCDGIECYGDPGGGSGGTCGGTKCVSTRSSAYCTDGHTYMRVCGGDTACSCECDRDGAPTSMCSYAPLPCAEHSPEKVCYPKAASCGFPRYVPTWDPAPKLCETNADCLPPMPKCGYKVCER